ncbi:MAG: sigma factor-like helix-turn-helix DNA-binding protein [Candidatus Nezhaarchaeales archaeon]
MSRQRFKVRWASLELMEAGSRRIWRGYAKKVTEEVKRRMVELRGQGLSYKAIAEVLGLSPSAVCYHLNEEYRAKSIASAMKRRVKTVKDRERDVKYVVERYRVDEEFRERVRRSARESMRRKRELKRILRDEYPEYREALRTYAREAKKLGQAEAWRRHRERIDELRARYGIEFPY